MAAVPMASALGYPGQVAARPDRTGRHGAVKHGALEKALMAGKVVPDHKPG